MVSASTPSAAFDASPESATSSTDFPFAEGDDSTPSFPPEEVPEVSNSLSALPMPSSSPRRILAALGCAVGEEDGTVREVGRSRERKI